LAKIRGTKVPSASVPKTPVELVSIKDPTSLRRKLSIGLEEKERQFERQLNARTTSYEKRPPAIMITATNSKQSLKSPAAYVPQNPMMLNSKAENRI